MRKSRPKSKLKSKAAFSNQTIVGSKSQNGDRDWSPKARDKRKTKPPFRRHSRKTTIRDEEGENDEDGDSVKVLEKTISIINEKQTIDILCNRIAENFWDTAWEICSERFYHGNAPSMVALELRDTWLRIIESEWLDQDQAQEDLPHNIFVPDEPPDPIIFDSPSTDLILNAREAAKALERAEAVAAESLKSKGRSRRGKYTGRYKGNKSGKRRSKSKTKSKSKPRSELMSGSSNTQFQGVGFGGKKTNDDDRETFGSKSVCSMKFHDSSKSILSKIPRPIATLWKGKGKSKDRRKSQGRIGASKVKGTRDSKTLEPKLSPDPELGAEDSAIEQIGGLSTDDWNIDDGDSKTMLDCVPLPPPEPEVPWNVIFEAKNKCDDGSTLSPSISQEYKYLGLHPWTPSQCGGAQGGVFRYIYESSAYAQIERETERKARESDQMLRPPAMLIRLNHGEESENSPKSGSDARLEYVLAEKAEASKSQATTVRQGSNTNVNIVGRIDNYLVADSDQIVDILKHTEVEGIQGHESHPFHLEEGEFAKHFDHQVTKRRSKSGHNRKPDKGVHNGKDKKGVHAIHREKSGEKRRSHRESQNGGAPERTYSVVASHKA